MHTDTAHECCLEQTRGDWVRVAPDTSMVRIEARFSGHAYSPHRHDTMALGVTLEGLQCFGFRGALQRATPGDVLVLPPDELHDGRAGTDSGFRYRMLYLDPDALRHAGDGQLALIEGGVMVAPDLTAAIRPALADLQVPLDPLAETALLTEVADALARRRRGRVSNDVRRVDERAVQRARALLLSSLEHGVSLAELERVTDRSRYSLNRHFRAACGVSPHRWLVMRRLDRARHLLAEGQSAAHAALQSGFADQSHMTRHFRSAFGMSPGQWQAFVAVATDREQTRQ